jgi:putative endopeptidase
VSAGLGRVGAAVAACLFALMSASGSEAPNNGGGSKVTAGMDLSVLPGNDFFRYANGDWLKTTEIPADRSNYGTFGIVGERTLQRTDALLKEAAGAAAGSEARKLGDYYATFMDEAAIEAAGAGPLQPRLAHIAAVTDRKSLARELGSTLRADVDVLNNTNLHTPNLFGLWVAQDLDDPRRYAPTLLQGGLEMPDRDYYLNPSEPMAKIRDEYRAHIARVLQLAKIPDAQAKAGRIFELERRLAQTHSSRADSEDVDKGDNHWKRGDFDKLAPGMDWAAWRDGAGLQNASDFIVWQPGAVKGAAQLVASEPVDTWKDYLTFHLIDDASGYLPKAFVEEGFAFHDKTLSGTPELPPRWKRAVAAVNEAMGEAAGKLYVQRYFPASEKQRAQGMVKALLTAFSARIDRLEWMAPATKQKAKAKLAVLQVSVGYPDRWRDYSSLGIVRGDALGNRERAQLFEYHRNLAKLGSPVDRSEWVMTAHLVNAVNLPVMNAINIPAAILQPPFFDPNRPMVMDFGAIGAVIGHEISHSFDDQGAKFDATGRLKNWWTPEDLKHFREAGARLAAQYDQYRPFPDVHVNGKQTLSENVADVAGIATAYDAWHLSTSSAAATDGADGFTGEQLFFISFGQNYRFKIREPAYRQRLVTDGHAPSEYRADTVRNIDQWYAAFAVKPGQGLYLAPASRVRLW